MSRLSIIMTAVIALTVNVSGQVPTRDAGPAPAAAPIGTASIGGVVVSADASAKPIRLAYVVIIGSSTGTLRVTATDSNGRFAFGRLPADRYLIGASKLPFLGSVAGAKRPGRSGTPIALADGQHLVDVAIRLPLGAAITGTITDDRGQPGANVAVTLQRWRVQNGERALVPAPGGTVYTDERGGYRVYGLPPGEYVVTAARQGGQSSARALTDAAVDDAIKGGRVAAVTGAASTVRYAPVFYPGTSRPSEAAPVVLAVGEERQNVDFGLELVRTARVEGIVTTRDGQPPPVALPVLMTSGSGVLTSTMIAPLSPDGRFAFPNVVPGSYLLVARSGGSPAQFATSAIDVGGADQSGLQLVLRPPLTFSARLAFDGSAPAPSLAGRRVPLRSLTPLGTAGPQVQVGVTSASGEFTVTNVSPGRYVLGGPLFFGATADSVTWALQSVVIDGRDVTDLPFEITTDSVLRDVAVTYGDRWQELSGRLLRASGQPAPDYTVIAFPAEKAYWIPGSRRIVTAQPGTDGQFVLSGRGPATLPPGRYLLAAVTDLARDEQFDPAFLASLVSTALPVILEPGARQVQNLAIKNE